MYMFHGEDRVFEKGNYGITERWYQVFAKSHDSGSSFDKIITFDLDPKSIDTVGGEGDFVFAQDDYGMSCGNLNIGTGKHKNLRYILPIAKTRAMTLLLNQFF